MNLDVVFGLTLVFGFVNMILLGLIGRIAGYTFQTAPWHHLNPFLIVLPLFGLAAIEAILIEYFVRRRTKA